MSNKVNRYNGHLFEDSDYCTFCGKYLHDVGAMEVKCVGKTDRMSKIIKAGYDYRGKLWYFDTSERVIFQEGDDSENRGIDCDSLTTAREFLVCDIVP